MSCYWIYLGDYDSGYKVNVKCSHCDKIISGDVWEYEFCPYCGSYNKSIEESVKKYNYYYD